MSNDIKTVYIGGKVSDMFNAQLVDLHGKIIEEHNGYVPVGSNVGQGDYIEFAVDNKTGQILNWKPIETLSDKT